MTSTTVPFNRCDTVEDVWTCQSRESTDVINNSNENCNPVRSPIVKSFLLISHTKLSLQNLMNLDDVINAIF